MLKAVRREEARVHHLPGRDWYLCIGPENSEARNATLGLAVFPPDSAPEGHVHPGEEELLYIVSGRGRLVTPQGTIELTPGTSVYIPPGLHHATASFGPAPLELVSVFSPPVAPGSYEARSRAAAEVAP